jgi:deoxyribodipyrimidine photolyase-related protein
METVWVLGDQLNLEIGALATVRPGSARVLMIESASKLAAALWHVQRAHFLIASMRRFSSEVAALGYEVDYRHAETFAQGLADHRAEFSPSRIVVTEPNSHRGRSLALRENVGLVRSNQFLCHYDDFATWARSRKHLRLEDFYRRQRVQLDYLMDDDEPEGGRWNFDEENRQPPPRRGPYPWPGALTEPLDALDHDVVSGLPANCAGSPPTGLWPRAGPLPCDASTTSSSTLFLSLALTKMRWSPTTSTSPTRCCRRTSTTACCLRVRWRTGPRLPTGPALYRSPPPRDSPDS